MDAAVVNPREQRGLALAKTKGKRFKQIDGDTWLVPSQSENTSGGYVVDLSTSSCSCPDFEKNGGACKHQFAVRFFRHELTMPDGSTVVSQGVKISYPQKWPAYNKAQTEEKECAQILLGSLCDGIVEPKVEGKRGRPRLPLRDVVFSATMKVYTTMSGRRASTDIRACEEDGHVKSAPSYNSIFRAIERPELMPLLRTLVDESAKPLAAVEKSFAVDGTGFATQTYVRWFDHKHGEDRRVQRWVKAHAMVGTLTNVVTAVEAAEGTVNDSPMFAGLVQRTAANGFDVREVSADKAYLSHDNLALVEKVGGVPYIPFKSNSGSSGSAAWERMYHLYSLRNDEFKAHYHKRSNVESTFSAMKRKFGAAVRSKLPAAQLNEVMLKCLCHNLSMLVHSIHELQIEPKFWMPATCEGQP